jgi:hypothetical protein
MSDQQRLDFPHEMRHFSRRLPSGNQGGSNGTADRLPQVAKIAIGK